MLSPITLVHKEKLSILQETGELRVSGTKLMECEAKVNGLCLRFIEEFTFGREGRTALVGSEHQNALEQIHIREFISSHQWIKFLPFTP